MARHPLWTLFRQPEFDPRSFGLALWLKADAGLYQDAAGTTLVTSDSDPVGLWVDQSGNARHHSQSTSSARPTWKINTQNGLPALRTDGVDDFFTPAISLEGLTAATAFLVVKAFADPQAFGKGGLWHYSSSSAASNSWYTYTDGAVYDSFGSTTRESTGDPATNTAQFNIYRVISKSGGWSNYLNGTQHYTTGTNTVGWSTAANTTLGKAGTAYFNGWLGEFLVYDSELSAGNIALVEAYLRTRWGTP